MASDKIEYPVVLEKKIKFIRKGSTQQICKVAYYEVSRVSPVNRRG